MAVLEHNTMHADSDEQQTSNSSPSSLPAPSTMPVSLLVHNSTNFHLGCLLDPRLHLRR